MVFLPPLLNSPRTKLTTVPFLFRIILERGFFVFCDDADVAEGADEGTTVLFVRSLPRPLLFSFFYQRGNGGGGKDISESRSLSL